MLEGGIFLDTDNLMRNGGWGNRYDVVREFAEAQGVTILWANAYMAGKVQANNAREMMWDEEPVRV